MVILDTNIIIDHLRQEPNKKTMLRRLVEKEGYKNLSLSLLSIQELFTGRSTQIDRMQTSLLATVAPLQLLPYTFAIAQMAGELIRDNKQTCTFVDATAEHIMIKPTHDIIDIAGTLKPKRKKPLLKAREIMEKQYQRV
ncbi:hypothetical protein A2690_03215 [Candidatus Roizmanbacteria bacterium RIFCSPHIGHO2_01_FULL_39_12b]|uniref:PIN domain-containing protein n=1 Tax=Candidatus Roizmanbacteria bacterium RIFCSPHIGHO2_01_FULL_39_12b TaxID=1802030 RepID=A0A1F7GCB9_9BACT|nr:MAG: hypothetical protein A2690_03215 [Candidatus Roizmanbacteria bacterium RIFCSPHIGHO2_01_FULL_39_12b]